MKRRGFLLTVATGVLSACGSLAPQRDAAQVKEQVIARELTFAKTMADRDHAAFSTFISEEAVFLNGGKPLHGKA
ncbi:MAG: DUF4440 domain-containing protein, partial [Burkholderiaceae bacterium]